MKQLVPVFGHFVTAHCVAEPNTRKLTTRCRFLLMVSASRAGRQRAVLELRYFNGCTHAETVAQLRIPLSTVKTRARAAVQALSFFGPLRRLAVPIIRVLFFILSPLPCPTFNAFGCPPSWFRAWLW